MHLYRYLCPQRPPGPGAVPRDGLQNVEFFDSHVEDAGGHPRHIWGAVEYDRELTDEEVCDYELIFDGEG